MAIEYKGKIYRNLEEQVGENMKDIQELSDKILSKPKSYRKLDASEYSLTSNTINIPAKKNASYIIYIQSNQTISTNYSFYVKTGSNTVAYLDGNTPSDNLVVNIVPDGQFIRAQIRRGKTFQTCYEGSGLIPAPGLVEVEDDIRLVFQNGVKVKYMIQEVWEMEP